MQTEHLAAVESDLAERGVPAEIVEKHFLGLHRCDELPLELWIGMITDAHNLATATAAAPSHVAALAIEWAANDPLQRWRSEEHTSELQSLMRISYAVFCLKKHTKCTK